MTGADPLATLGVQVQGIASRQHATDNAVKDIVRKLNSVQTVMTQAIERLGAQQPQQAESEPGAVTAEWLTMTDPQAAADVLVETWRWVRAVWRWHHPQLRPCWPLHPRVVEDLRAMRATWDAALKAPDKPALMTGWLVQARRPIVDGITAAMPDCTLTEHRDESTVGRSVRFVLADPPELTLVEVAEWWTDHHGDTSTPAPGLSEVTR